MMDFVFAFLIGGIICAISQILIEYLKFTPAICTSLFVIGGGVLELFGIYEPLIKIGSSGATIPITNFGRLVTKSSYEGILEKGILGALNNVLASVGAGISFTLLIALIVSLIFKPRE